MANVLNMPKPLKINKIFKTIKMSTRLIEV